MANVPPVILIQNELENKPLKVKATIKILVKTTKKADFSPRVIRIIKVMTLAKPNFTPGTKNIIPEMVVSTIDKTTDMEIMIAINISLRVFKISNPLLFYRQIPEQHGNRPK